MLIKEIMTGSVETIPPAATIQQAAGAMKRLDVGALPVTVEDHAVGIITDRDIAIRVVAEGRDLDQTSVNDVMTTDPVSVPGDAQVAEVASRMCEEKIRRVLIHNSEGTIEGIVSLADIVLACGQSVGGEVLESVSCSSCEP